MPDIRYVCLSDMHLGEEDSLLTNLKVASPELDHSAPSPVMKLLVECLRELISKNQSHQKPTLILNGDILEMALTTDNQAAMCFDRFIELIMPQGDELFKNIIFIPGNHDHHLWESARETQYANYISKITPEDIKSGTKQLDPPWHTTNIFVEDDPNPVTAFFLTRLIKRFPHLSDTTIQTAYPNFGLLNSDGKRCVLFHHGHFVESIYQLMSTLKVLIFPNRQMPKDIWHIEDENFAWIDFFWSTMGRSGEAGQDIEIIYEKMQNSKEFKKLLSNMVDGIAKKYDLPGWDFLTAKAIKGLLDLAVDKISKAERAETSRLLSHDAEKGLWTYMNGPLQGQVLNEIMKRKDMPLQGQILNELRKKKNIKEMFTNVTFVFGHTHKPFEEDMNFKEYQNWTNVYNTGGWVVETEKPEPLHGGAVVLIDEALNATSIRMYNESDHLDKYSVSVKEAIHPGDNNNPFHAYIQSLINPNQQPWKDFSDAVARAVSVRAQNLKSRILERA